MLSCKNSPLHGRAGDRGIIECNTLVQELERMKASSLAEATKKDGDSSGTTPAKSETPADDDGMLRLGLFLGGGGGGGGGGETTPHHQRRGIARGPDQPLRACACSGSIKRLLRWSRSAQFLPGHRL